MSTAEATNNNIAQKVQELVLSLLGTCSTIKELKNSLKSEDFLEQLQNVVKKANKRSKKLKDPNAPKKPLSAYFLYCADRRPEIKEEEPDLKVTEVSKKLGLEWKALKDSDENEDKAKLEEYKNKVDRAKKKYEKRMKSYKRPSDDVLADLPENKTKTRTKSGKTSTPRKPRDKNAPKGKKSAYTFFASAKRPEIKEEMQAELQEDEKLDSKAVTKAVSDLWKSLDEDDKEEYAAAAKKDAKRYTREMAEYLGKKAESEKDDDETEEKPKKKKTRKVEVTIEKPTKPSRNKAAKKHVDETEDESVEENADE
jgi:HMG (high mobility group) box/HMG-box domain